MNHDQEWKTYEHEIKRAQQHAQWLKDKISKTSNPRDIDRMGSELIRLFRASHPDHQDPPVGLSREECEVPGLVRCPVHDSAYTLTNVPTRDAGMHFHAPTRDKTIQPEAVDRIMEALKDICRRTIALEKRTLTNVPTRGPGVPAPRALNPQQAYQAAMTVYQMEQARATQRRAHEARPDLVPQHPLDAEDDAREQYEALRDTPHYDTQPTHDANARAKIAKLRHVTFGNGAQPGRINMRQNHTRDTEAEAAREMREREAALMSDMVQTIQTELGD
jgi:hypothetical protein